MKIIRDGLRLMNLHGDYNSMGNEGVFQEFADVARTMREIQSRAGLETVKLSLHDLQNSMRELSVFHGILTAKDMKLNISEISHESLGPASHMFGYFDFEVGGFTFLVVFDAPITERSTHENRIVLNCGKRV